MAVYGGDEVSALVFDIGASTTRCGYAGDDTPKAVFSTSYGYVSQSSPSSIRGPDEMATDETKVVRHFGEQGPSMWRSGMEVTSPIKDGLIHDFDPIPSMISHAIETCLGCNPQEHPVLVTEPTWNTPANRERIAEIMFEEFKIPAFYIANTGVLNAFAAGKGSALVVDIGHDIASVTPVFDGFVLRKGVNRSSIPSMVRSNAHYLLTHPFENRPPATLLPHQLIANRKPVDAFQPPNFTVRDDRMSTTTDSWKSWAEQREVDEWLLSVGGILEQGWSVNTVQQRPPRQYEFPTGFNAFFGTERYLSGEIYFSQAHLQFAVPEPPKTINMLCEAALSACDPDLRMNLLNHVVLTGGGSLMTGFADRLTHELNGRYGTGKVQAAGNILERKHGAWLGGSILGSLGTFQQLWISQEEWREHGKGILAQRCK